MDNTRKLPYNKLKDKILKLEKELNEIKNSRDNLAYSGLINELRELRKKNDELLESDKKLLINNKTEHKSGKDIKNKSEENFGIFNSFYSGIYILQLEKADDPDSMRLIYGNSVLKKIRENLINCPVSYIIYL